MERFSSDVSCIVLCLGAQLCPTLCGPMDCSPPGSFVHGDSPGKNTGVGCHALSMGINPGLLHCRRILYCLSHQRKPIHALVNINFCLYLKGKGIMIQLHTCHQFLQTHLFPNSSLSPSNQEPSLTFLL